MLIKSYLYLRLVDISALDAVADPNIRVGRADLESSRDKHALAQLTWPARCLLIALAGWQGRNMPPMSSSDILDGFWKAQKCDFPTPQVDEQSVFAELRASGLVAIMLDGELVRGVDFLGPTKCVLKLSHGELISLASGL